MFQKPIAWFVIVALFVLMMLPIHIHIHHDLELDSHHGDGHVIDYHIMIDDNDHALQGQTHTIETSSDLIIKQSAGNLFKLVVLISFITLALLQILSYYQRWFKLITSFYQKYYILSPPLRAPPF